LRERSEKSVLDPAVEKESLRAGVRRLFKVRETARVENMNWVRVVQVVSKNKWLRAIQAVIEDVHLLWEILVALVRIGVILTSILVCKTWV
jgi:hypothetical protein